MSSFSLSGGVQVFGFISPNDTLDQYAVIDPLYGIDGLRNVDTITDLDLISSQRRRPGMVVGVSGGTTYYKLNPEPWNFDLTDWDIFSSGGGGGGNFTGGTVTGATEFIDGLSANTISATTYFNLPTDVFVTGGTYNNGEITFTNNVGNIFNVNGFYTGQTSYVNSLSVGVGLSANTTQGDITIINTAPDQLVSINGGTNVEVLGSYPNFTVSLTGLTDNDRYLTGFTYQNNNLTITDNSGLTLTTSINTVTGLTSSGTIQSNTISASTYQNLPTDIYVTGGTYSAGILSLTNSIGNVVNVTGFTNYFDNGLSSVSTNIDWSNGNTQELDLDNDPSLTFSNGVPGTTLSLLCKQELPGQRTVTWPVGVLWNNNLPVSLPTLPITGSSGDYDLSFSFGTGFNGQVNSIAVQSDGKVLAGGQYTLYNGASANRIIRLNGDGTVDGTFVYGTGFNNEVRSIALQPNGKVLVGGTFTTYNGTGANRIIRLNSDGTVDGTFVYVTGFNNLVRSIVLQPDGKIIMAGGFTSYNGTVANQIIRLNGDGTVDGTFVYGTGFSGGFVLSVALQPDGKVLVGGDFTSYNGTGANRIIRLNSNGTVDVGFVYGTGVGSRVRSIALQPDGKVLVGGEFTSYNGTGANRIIRLNSDGTVDGGFSYGTGFNSFVRSITVQPDGKVLVGGDFTSYNGTGANRIIRLNSNGTVDGTFVYGTGFSDGQVNSIVLQSDGKILVGGIFFSYNSIGANSSIRLNSDGSIDTGFYKGGTGFDGAVNSIAVQSDGKVLAGGDFTIYNGIGANRIIRLNGDGTVDGTFVYGTGFDITPRSIVLQSDGKIIVGGEFTSYNGTGANRIIRLNSDGTVDGTFVYVTGFNNLVRSIVLQPDGKIIMAGGFTSYNGTVANQIIRLNGDGTVDGTFVYGTGFNIGQIYSIALQPDGKILAGGQFTSYNGTSANRIIRLNSDGTVDGGFVYGTGFNSTVWFIALQPDGKILVSGFFTTYNGTGANRIIRLNSNGTRDVGFVYGTGFDNTPLSIVAQSDGKILLCGFFTSYNGTGANRIVRLNSNGTVDITFLYGTGFIELALSIVLQSDGKILVGGNFFSYNGTGVNRIARILGVDTGPLTYTKVSFDYNGTYYIGSY